jgi:CRP/FNR family cyclic AMP-dependent transcriptional regulator
MDGALGRVYEDGEVVMREGDTGACMYVIEEGRVQVSVRRGDEELPLRILGPGEIVGEMAIFENEPRSATVKALGTARILTIDRKGFLRRVHEDPSLAFRILQTMSHRIRDLTEEVARLRTGGSHRGRHPDA